MAIRLSCPSCGSLLEVGDHLAGQQVQCGGCRSVVRVPDAEATYADYRPAPPVVPPSAPRSGDPDTLSARAYDGPAPRPGGPRGGCGCVAWGLALGFVGCVLLCCGGLLLFAIVAHEDWQEYRPPDGAFKVELPAPPQDDLLAKLEKGGKGKKKAAPPKWEKPPQAFGTLRVIPPELFAVFSIDPPFLDFRRTPGDQLKEVATALTREWNGALVGDPRPTTVGDAPALDVVVKLPDKEGLMVARLVFTPKKVHVVAAGGPQMTADNERARHFIDSFELLDNGPNPPPPKKPLPPKD